jgi:holo-[acyl-carrier protein] synthase
VTGLGIDLCAISRIEALLKENCGFLERYYTPEERAYLETRGQTVAQSAAAMFAAKEAFLKALGIGLSGGVALSDISIAHDASGCPRYVLQGKAQARLEEKGAQTAYLSLTHDGGMAAAVCALE